MLRYALPLLALTLCLPLSAQGALMITIEDTTVAPGDTAKVNVFIESDGSDSLTFVDLTFQITTAGATRLEFVDPQSNSQEGEGNYVFATGGNLGVSSTVSETSVPNDTLLVGDGPLSVVTLTSADGPFLLAQLDVTAATTLAPAPGDTFSVSLVSATLFDETFTPLSLPTPVAPGTVRVASANVIPEPATLSVWGGLGLAGLAIGRFRRRKGGR